MTVKIGPAIGGGAKSCTTRQPEENVNLWPWEREDLMLTVTGEGLFWKGKQVPLRRFPVYLSPEDPRRKVPFTEPEEDEFARNRAAKQIWLPHGCFYRCPGTGVGWIRSGRPRYITLCDASAWVDILILDEEQAALERYVLTEDPREEDVSTQEFEYVRHLGVLTITGIRHYCERLHIPAELDGIPVENVFLATGVNAPYLRELSVANGVRKLDFPFGFPELELIDLPSSVRLVRPPDGIRHTAWFTHRPDGPVYFHGYYCGTRGTPEGDCLDIREGTVGVTRWADEEIAWKRIRLPASLAYISASAFCPCGGLEEVEYTRETEALKAYFRRPFGPNTLHRQSGEGLMEGIPSGQPLTGSLLYDLGRSSAAVRRVIPRQWLPTAPRLSYDKGWIAEYWYCAETSRDAGYYAAFRLPSGEPLAVEKRRKERIVSTGCWTEAYLPPEYLLAEDYLNCCAAAVRGGEPTGAILEQLDAWWKRLMPQKVLEQTEGETRVPVKEPMLLR